MVCHAGEADGPSDGLPEIDKLASLLAREAAKLRSSLDEEEFRRSYEDPDAYIEAAKETPFGSLVGCSSGVCNGRCRAVRLTTALVDG